MEIFRVRFILLRLNIPNTAFALQVWPSAASAMSFLYPFSFWMFAQTLSKNWRIGFV